MLVLPASESRLLPVPGGGIRPKRGRKEPPPTEHVFCLSQALAHTSTSAFLSSSIVTVGLIFPQEETKAPTCDLLTCPEL